MENGMLDVLMNYISSYALILIPFLMIIGAVIKNTKTIKDEFIPIILIGIGIAASILMNGFNMDSVIQGVLVAGASVLAHQTYKQLNSLKEEDGKENK